VVVGFDLLVLVLVLVLGETDTAEAMRCDSTRLDGMVSVSV
jgi:hypothetical protein